MAIRSDRSIVAAGTAASNNGDIALARYEVSGGLDERLYAQQDANFNTAAITDVFGRVVERYAYDPYGKFVVLNGSAAADKDGAGVTEWAPDGTNASDVGWLHFHQGGRYEASTGLYDFRHRSYSPTLMRWTQADPLGYADGMSLYQAYLSSPGDFVDPWGLSSEDVGVWGGVKEYLGFGQDRPPGDTQSPLPNIWTDDLKELAAEQAAAVESAALNSDTPCVKYLAIPAGAMNGAMLEGLNQGTDPSELAMSVTPGGKGAKGVVKGVKAAGTVAGVVKPAAKAVKPAKKVVGAAKGGAQSASSAKEATGSYTITFKSGKKYHGKGRVTRAKQSAKERSVENCDPATKVEWKPASDRREAFKAEGRRIRADGGADNPKNYNDLNSPGERYLQEDGE